MSKAPAMPFYVDAFMADTMDLSEAEEGVYLRLLMCMWRSEGKLPNDDTRLARMVRVSKPKWVNKYRPVLEKFFDVSGDFLTQKRLKKEWEYVQGKIEKNRENGRKRGKTKVLKNNNSGSANGSVSLKPNESQTPSETEANSVITHPQTHKDIEYKYSLSSTGDPDFDFLLAQEAQEVLKVRSRLSPDEVRAETQRLIRQFGSVAVKRAYETSMANAAGSPLKYITQTLENGERKPNGHVQQQARTSLAQACSDLRSQMEGAVDHATATC